MVRKFLAPIAAAIFIIAPIQAAIANCALRNLAGEWQFYATWWTEGTGLDWDRCTLVLDKNGEFLSASDCEEAFDLGNIVNPTVVGSLTVTQDCVVTGSADVTDPGEAPETEHIVHAVMNSRKDMIVGVGAEDSGGPSAPFWTFSMIKK